VSLTIGGNSNLLQFSGTYGLQYDALRSSNLSSWSSVTSFIAPQNGSINYTDSIPLKPAAFYRLRQD